MSSINPSPGSRIATALLLAAVLGLAGCSTGPVTVTCADIGFTAVTDPSERVQLTGFSILPPAGPHWCVRDVGAGTAVAFGKNQFGGRTLQLAPTLEEQAHTFVAAAYAADVDGPRPGDGAALRAFVERWLGNGALSQPQDSGKLVVSDKPVPGSEVARFTTVQSEVAVDSSHGAVCVRYSSITEERDNPRAAGGIFVIDAPESYVCLHPTATNKLIVLDWSERYIKDRRPGPPYVETLRPEIEHFLRSIQFDAAG